MTTTDDLLKEISGKLDKMTKLFAVDAIKNCATEQEKIELLDSLGFTSSEIARLLNKSVENVCTQLKNISRKKEKSKKDSTETATEKKSPDLEILAEG
jgi:DNA-binding NarL/FixJ family response regulator